MTQPLHELLREMRDHDSEKAFRALFDMQYDRMWRIAYYYTQNDDAAREVTLDVLAELWNRRHTMVMPTDWNRFSYTMVRNAALNVIEREQRHHHEQLDSASITPDADPGEGMASAAESSSRPDADTERHQLFEVYEQTLAELPDRCRETWQRVKEEGQSYAEVAEEMGVSTKTVDAQLQKALKFLRDAIGNFLS